MTPPDRPISVVLVDDHPVVRGGLRALIESFEGFSVVGEAADGEQAVREVLLHQPDAVIMDVMMPRLDGVEATRRIVRASPSTAVLVLSMAEDDDVVFSAMQAGARGYLLKGAAQEEIDRALKAVVAGEAIFGPGVAARVLGLFSRGTADRTDPFPELTPREREVLELVAQGRRNAAVGRTLGMASKTVANHLSSIFAKLQVTDRSAAIVRARDNGLGRGRSS
ncbi:response regulator transcription factor [Actinoplanes friuliensis]|jgi:DNA-binding NarL/FixJ family response regulator|uniref:Two-component system response regulator n=1 Tax=Actinoplanes friuliensis DSM 7358 TaxID=1246995 RepID=U5VW84_9ACTN|nr:response regulator transcription factor [Actinoplanes friuliensis]AGZ41099.1 two-component system response regulator [Actinoplanes friuliensis DSM 7358]